MNFLDLMFYWAVKGINRVFTILPIRLVLAFGRAVGRVVYHISSSRRCVAYANIRLAFSRTKTPSEMKRLLRAVYENISETFCEVLSLTKVNKAYIDKYITIENEHYLNEALTEKKGVIFLTAHFGDWELSGIVSSTIGYPLYVLAREQKMKRVNEILNKLRESKGSKVIRKGITTRLIVRALHEGKIIGMVADQNGGSNGIQVDFFGRPASTASGPYRFAARTGAVIVPVFTCRKKGPYTRIVVEKPVRIKDGEDIVPHIENYNKLLERYIRMYPDKWLWVHRRWKHSPYKKIVILSDGKAGHLNQSLGLAGIFKKFRCDKKISPVNTEIEVVDIKFRNRFRKNIFNLISIFSSHKCQGCQKCLKYALEPSSYKKLVKTYSDVVISTGYSMAGVNRIFSYENNSKSACVMRPGFLSRKRFDMVVLPRHDARKGVVEKNVVVTDVALSPVDDEFMKKGSAAIKPYIKKVNGPLIGFLFGGDNQDFKYSPEKVADVVGQIISAARDSGAGVMATTSRRTSVRAEKAIKDRLGSFEGTSLLVVANEKNIPNAIGGILDMCNVIVVSGESVSMISEAAASGKQVLVFKGERLGRGKGKYDDFLDNMVKEGYVEIAGQDELYGMIKAAVASEKSSKPSGGVSRIYENMWRLGA